MAATDIYPGQQSDELTEAELAGYRQALELARHLPFALQLDLAQNILGIVREGGCSPKRKNGYARIAGRWKTDKPAPTDEEVGQMLEDERLAKQRKRK